MYKLSVLAFAAALLAPLASALTLEQPSNPTSDGEITIKWTPGAGDPQVFSLQLTNDIFHNTFAIANNVNTGQNEITLTLPTLQPGDGYTIIAHDIGNINNVYAQTGDFNVGASTSSSAASSSAASATRPATASAVTLSSITPNTSGFGTTRANTNPASSAAGSATSAGASASQTPSGAEKSVVFGAASSVAAVVLSLVAGGAWIAL